MTDTERQAKTPRVLADVSAPPVYRDPRGRFRPISGPAADAWPHPRRIEVDGARFVEEPDYDTGWRLTYHYEPRIWRRQTPAGVFITQYAEGMSSGFPWWSVVMFSARSACYHPFRPTSSLEPTP